MPGKSTSALTEEQHAAQDKRYAQGRTYDYVIVGTGNSALTTAALLVNAGKTVCMLEAHDIPGGYAQNFRRGEYVFNAQVHYIWGCAPGGKIYEFLKKIGLHEDITFEMYDPDGYDQMVMPDGKRVKFPYGFDRLADNVTQAYPDQGEAVRKFIAIIKTIRDEMHDVPDSPGVWHYLKVAPKMRTIIKYRNHTVQDVFDQCGLSIEAQTVLAANMGDYMSPPRELSFMMYIALLGGYNTGAYYPTKHYKYYIERLVEFITSHDGCDIYYETKATKVNREGNRVVSIETENGKTFIGEQYIWNGDPQKAAAQLGWEHFSRSQRKKLQYEYSLSGTVIYLGLKDIDLTKYGFGKHNIWHFDEWDVNTVFDAQLAPGFADPQWLFISTPTLHSDAPGTAPEGHQIMELATHTSVEPYAEAAGKSRQEYARMKKGLAEGMIDFVEKHYIPDIRKHIDMRVVGTSLTNEHYVGIPGGGAYGADMIPKQVGLGRPTSTSPWENFFWCSASAGYPGMYGTVLTGAKLYADLTGDRVYTPSQAPTDAEFIEAALKRAATE